MRSTPFSQEEGYRSQAFSTIKTLLILDNLDRDGKELEYSADEDEDFSADGEEEEAEEYTPASKRNQAKTLIEDPIEEDGEEEEFLDEEEEEQEDASEEEHVDTVQKKLKK